MLIRLLGNRNTASAVPPHILSSLLSDISLNLLLDKITSVGVQVPKFHSHDISGAADMSLLIRVTPLPNRISTVPTSVLDLGVMAQVGEGMLLAY
jgi:hypothetical protein